MYKTEDEEQVQQLTAIRGLVIVMGGAKPRPDVGCFCFLWLVQLDVPMS